MKIVLSIIFLFINLYISGQIVDKQLISSAGDDFKNSDIQLNFSIGETITASFETSDFYLLQGYQQPSILNSTYMQNKNVSDEIAVYPNPAYNDIIVSTTMFKSEFKILIIDCQGRVLLSTEMDGPTSLIDISVFEKGIYFMKLISEDKNQTQIKKIIKQ